MKKVIVASAAITAIGILIVGCAEPGGAVRQTDNPSEPTLSVPRLGTDEVRLEAIQQSVQQLIAQEMITGEPLDYCFQYVQTIEKAKQALRELDGQRCATHMLISQYLVTGEPIPDYVYGSAQTIEQSGQEILKGIGLAH